MIQEAKIFMNGRSQAIRLPKEYRFTTESVYINKVGKSVLLTPKENPWESMVEACSKFSSDFMDEREQGEYESREAF